MVLSPDRVKLLSRIGNFGRGRVGLPLKLAELGLLHLKFVGRRLECTLNLVELLLERLLELDQLCTGIRRLSLGVR